MSNVEFEEESAAPLRPFPVERQSGMHRLLLKSGLARTDAQARRILIGIAIVFLAATAYMMYYRIFGGGPDSGAPTTVRTAVPSTER